MATPIRWPPSCLLLILAILFEVAGTTFMKISDGFSKTMPSVAMTVFYLLSLAMLTFALKKFEVSTAYAIWSGLGVALIFGSMAATVVSLFFIPVLMYNAKAMDVKVEA